jgi:outer membrane protein assembly factor BamB
MRRFFCVCFAAALLVWSLGIAQGAGRPGTLKWKYETEYGVISSSPAIGADGTVYVGSGDGNLYALNAKGTRKWSYFTGGEVSSSPAIGADGTIYVGSGDGNLYAINPDGTLKWSCATNSANPNPFYLSSSPAISADGTIYVGSGDGSLYAINPNGNLKWSYATLTYYLGIASSPAIGADGTIYVGSDDNRLYALNPDGTLKWSYSDNPDCPGTSSSPAIDADGTIYVGLSGPLCFDGLYAINPDGTRKWAHYVGPSPSTPAIGADGTIYVGSYGSFQAINPDGTERWSYLADWVVMSSGQSSPVIARDGTIYFGSTESSYSSGLNSYGMLYALHSASPGLVDSPWPMFHHNPGHTGTPASPATLTVVKSGTGNGTIIGLPPRIDCGETCSTPFSTGTVVTLTAAPETGSTFVGWSGGCTGSGECSLLMTENISVTASFTGPPCTYTVTPSSTRFTSSGGTFAAFVHGKGVAGGLCAAPLISPSDPAWIGALPSAWIHNRCSVKITVNANTRLSGRNGTVAIGDKTLAIAQKEAPCAITMSTPASRSANVYGGKYSFNIYTSSPDCSWTATSSKEWITLIAASGKGNGDVAYTVPAGTEKKKRAGTITVTLDENPARKRIHRVTQPPK